MRGGHVAHLLIAATKSEQIKKSSHKLHRSEALVGSFDIPAAGDDRANRHHAIVRPKQRDQAELRIGRVLVGLIDTDLDRPVLILDDARLNDVGKCLDGGRSNLGRALIGTNMLDQLKPQLGGLGGLPFNGGFGGLNGFDQETGRFGAGHHDGLGRQEIAHKSREVRASGEEPLHQP